MPRTIFEIRVAHHGRTVHGCSRNGLEKHETLSRAYMVVTVVERGNVLKTFTVDNLDSSTNRYKEKLLAAYFGFLWKGLDKALPFRYESIKEWYLSW